MFHAPIILINLNGSSNKQSKLRIKVNQNLTKVVYETSGPIWKVVLAMQIEMKVGRADGLT